MKREIEGWGAGKREIGGLGEKGRVEEEAGVLAGLRREMSRGLNREIYS